MGLHNRLTLEEYQLSPSARQVLAVVEGAGEPLEPSVIAERVLITTGSMTSLLDNLEKRGLVRRERSVEDRRFIQVHLTEEGARLIRHVFPTHADAITRQLAVLTPEEQRALGNLCRKLGTVS